MDFFYYFTFFLPIILFLTFGFWLDRTIIPDKEKMRKKLYRVK